MGRGKGRVNPSQELEDWKVLMIGGQASARPEAMLASADFRHGLKSDFSILESLRWIRFLNTYVQVAYGGHPRSPVPPPWFRA